MNEVVDVLIKKGHVENVTEKCKTNKCTFDKLVSVDKFYDSDAKDFSMSRYLTIST